MTLKRKRKRKRNRDIERDYSVSQFVAKLRRLVDCLETKERFSIQIAGQRLHIPKDAIFNIEHEREDENEEIEFQIKWKNK